VSKFHIKQRIKLNNFLSFSSGSVKSLRAKTTRLSMTDALHRRFASCIYLKDDFVEQFKAKAARMREESEHRRELAVEE